MSKLYLQREEQLKKRQAPVVGIESAPENSDDQFSVARLDMLPPTLFLPSSSACLREREGGEGGRERERDGHLWTPQSSQCPADQLLLKVQFIHLH